MQTGVHECSDVRGAEEVHVRVGVSGMDGRCGADEGGAESLGARGGRMSGTRNIPPVQQISTQTER